MPKLARVRLVSTGHPRARFEDLLLDLRDQQHRATDTVLWLRNGGGKSSLLNLFYSVVRPRQTDFLGAKGGEEHRRLADYVQHDDLAVVACEWELDGDDILLAGEPLRYLTIALHEHKNSSPTDGSNIGLQRWFLATEVRSDLPDLTLEGLPLTSQMEDGRMMRRSLANFRRYWRDLQSKHPDCDIFLTDKQADWARQLESRGIDTQLFGYQLDMNSREGGVTQLFTFPDADSFVDFLLKTAFDPQDAERVRQQVQTFRTELLRRHRELQPDQELCEGLLERLSPFQGIADARSAIRKRLADIEHRRGSHAARLDSLQARLMEMLHKNTEEARAFAELAQEQQDRADRLEAEAVKLRYHALVSRLAIARSEHIQRKTEMDDAAMQAALWRAAVPLADVIKFKEEARVYRNQLQRSQSEHAPLIERLVDAASNLAAKLNAEAISLREKSASYRRESLAYRNIAKERRQQASQCASRAATTRSEAGDYERRLIAAENHWNKLRADGVTVEGEGLLSAQMTIARLATELDAIHKESIRLEELQADIHSERQSITQRRESTLVSKQRTEGEAQQLGNLVAGMSEARDKLASNRTLLTLLQADTVDVDRACVDAIPLARDQRRAALEAILDLRLGRADDERSLEFVRDSGRLPPTQDVLAVLEILRKLGIPGWSGWEYLEANVSRDQRRSVVRRQPHLVSGVIVGGDEMLGRVSESASMERLAGPVTIGTAEQLLSATSSREYVVWGPTDDALFDSTAAGRVEAEVAQRIDKSQESERRQEQWRESIDFLLQELERYEESYPAGWLENTLTKQMQLRDDASQMGDELTTMAARDAILQEDLRQLDAKAKELHRREISLRDAHRRTSDFYEQYGQHVAPWREKKRELEQDALSAAAKQESLEGEANENDELAAGADASDHQIAEQAATIEHERTGIRHARQDVSAPAGISIDSLRAVYRTLLDEYNEKVGADTLELLAEQRERDAEDSRRKFEKVRDPSVKEEDVATVLKSLPADVPVEDQERQAQEEHWAAKQSVGNASAQISRLEKSLRELEPDCQRLQINALEAIATDMTPDQAEEAAAQAHADSVAALKESQDASKIVQELREKELLTQAKVEKCSAVARRLSDIRENHADLLAEAGIPSCVTADKEGIDQAETVEPLELAVGQLASELLKEKQAWYDNSRLSEQHLKQLQEWCRNERFLQLPESVAVRFAQFTATEVETRVDYFREHLVTRLQQIKADLEEADRQRAIVVDAVMSSVEHALDLLKRIARLSKLPDTVAGGGRHFLDITTNAPDNPVERRGRVADLIDEVIQSGQLDSGLELVQRATRRVARPIRVKVLHPDLDTLGTRVSIQQMANFSGGERLTGAILLYCALARLRSQQLGITKKRTSVLLLDNPIGTVSRVRYLDLQREVARALGVQLVYATGVHDIDAVASLPNIVRLRNSRRDARTGRHVVETDTDGDTSGQDSVVDAIRIHTTPGNSGPDVQVVESGDE